ncbi:Fibronectin type III domain protein [Minicystis rosea]|nr:Fibronectin type III domain protein [Minicystis rosea]
MVTGAACGAQPHTHDEAEEETGVAESALGSDPDLVITSVSAPPAVSGPFTSTMTVCNQGTAGSAGTDVEVRLSTDAVIDLTDTLVGGTGVPSLNPGQCATLSINGGAAVPPGAYYLGALVDPNAHVLESSESNNAFAGGLIGVGYGPDLIVTSVSGPPSASGPFTATATVCNQGTAWSASTNVELRLSADTTITTGDAFAGGTSVPSLNAGQCATLSINGGAAVPPGAYYLGALVDPTSSVSELIESNNAFAGGLIGVGYGPDLVVTSLSAPPSASGPFTATVTVCNQGTAWSASTNMELRLSADTTITTGDAFAGGMGVPSLNPGQCATLGINGGAAVPPGAYSLGALVDPASNVPELIETNNAFAGGLIGVGYGPDLIVTSVSGPPSASGPFMATATVCNQGTTWSTGTNVELRLSADTTITTGDAFGGGTSVPPLNPGQCATLSINGGAAVPPGAYYLGALVDPIAYVSELIESNNAFAGGLIGVGNGPDLVVTTVSAPPSTSGPFTATATVCNQGTAWSAGTNVELRLSADTAITTGDAFAGGTSVPSLNAGQCATVSISGGAALPPGAYYLGALVDPSASVPELIESNNVFAGGLMAVGYGPDLIVTSVSVPPSVPGPFMVTVCNQGTTGSTSTNVELRLSTDSTVTGADTFAGGMSVPSLNAGQCATVIVSGGAAMPPGACYLGALVDPASIVSELLESNNVFATRVASCSPWAP